MNLGNQQQNPLHHQLHHLLPVVVSLMMTAFTVTVPVARVWSNFWKEFVQKEKLDLPLIIQRLKLDHLMAHLTIPR
uniref:Uncharacterized protein n=1 Tax=Panstrongylus lignarius TaxID=156445 RepID=A0A224Y3Z0_9HEMI